VTLKILAIHGINTPLSRSYAAAWRAALDLNVIIEEARWQSSGSIANDVFQICVNPLTREENIDDITEEVRDFCREPGEKLLLAAERRLATGLPIITIGGPLSHPVFGPALAAVGLRKPTPGEPPLRFWNEHDGVCCSRFLGARQPAWMGAVRIAVAGDTGWVVEHDAALYLQNENVRRAVQAAQEKQS
jgi:hypothetical protein